LFGPAAAAIWGEFEYGSAAERAAGISAASSSVESCAEQVPVRVEGEAIVIGRSAVGTSSEAVDYGFVPAAAAVGRDLKDGAEIVRAAFDVVSDRSEL
jgi:hypothetical protein